MDLFPQGVGAARRPVGSAASLTAADVRAQRFAVTKFREGYAQPDVDAFLDRVARSLDGTGRRLTPLEVLSSRFAAVKFKEGYDVEQVDDFLDRVVAALEARAGGAAVEASSAAAPASAPAAGPAWGLRETSQRLQLATAQALDADRLTVRTADGRVLGVVGLEATRDGVTLVVG